MSPKPTPSFSATVRFEYPNVVGMLGKVTSAIGEAGGDIGSIDIIKTETDTITRDINLSAYSIDHIHQLIQEIKKIHGINIIHVTDRTFAIHHGGKIEIGLKHPARNREDMAMVYTPGVARVCLDILEQPKHVYNYTIKGNTVAIVTDGSAVLGLGDIGPQAAMPVMEGKSMLFKQFANVDAFPICLNTKDPDEIVKVVKSISPTFGGINLEDISAPRCFEIEERLSQELDIPVFHDDQHGTAIVVLAALINALLIVGKELGDIRIAISGAGSAGIACTHLLIAAGVDPGKIIISDIYGTLCRGQGDRLNKYQQEIAEITNPGQVKGTIHEAIVGADLFLGVSAPNILTAKDIMNMAKDPIVFALANPTPEIMPEEAMPYAKIVATGRSDYMNQINNVLCFPGLFRGLLDSRATKVTFEMKLAAARAIAGLIKPFEMNEDYIIPSAFDDRTQKVVAEAVEQAAIKEKKAKKPKR
jgi:malate dehydrogenase (oxaloacetate-decarboxylating)